MKDIHDPYTTDEQLRAIHHPFDTNRNELFNKIVTKFVPKTSYLCRTICGKGRVYIAAGIDSVGYSNYYNNLHEMLGIPFKDCHKNMYTSIDLNRKYRTDYFRHPIVKKRKAERDALKIRKMMEDDKKAKEKGMTYKKDIAAPKVKRTKRSVQVLSTNRNKEGEGTSICELTDNNVTKKVSVSNEVKKTKCTESLCASCGQKGHSRNTHKDCLKSTNTRSRFFRK